MLLGELIPALREASSDPVVIRLIELLEDWRADTRTTEDLRQSVERYIGKSWIASDQNHEKIYALWAAFRDECIVGRGGMTMNERLFCFNLLDVWDDGTRRRDARPQPIALRLISKAIRLHEASLKARLWQTRRGRARVRPNPSLERGPRYRHGTVSPG